MSHFVSLIENALKAGDVRDPVFRESVYKSALRAFDKMSNGRPDRAEFRKVHGPQLAEAITRIEQKHVSLEDFEDVEFDVPSMRQSPDPREKEGSLQDIEPHIEIGAQNISADFDNEPPMADFDDDVFFDGEQRPREANSSGRFGMKLPLLIGAFVVLLLLAFLMWVFL